MHDCGLEAAPAYPGGVKRRPKLKRVGQTTHGIRAYVNARNVSAGPADFRSKADKIRNRFGCRDVAVSTHRHMITLDLLWTDPLGRPISAAKLPAPTKRAHVVVGLDEHGNGVERDVRLPTLIIGAPGSGKSTELWTTLRGLQRARIPHRVWVFDPKGGMELGALRDCAHRYVADASSWDTFLTDVVNAMKERELRQATAGIVKHVPTREDPLDVVIVDELVTAVAMGGSGSKVKIGKQTMTANTAFLVFLSSCRAAGFTVIAASQTAEKEVLGAARGMFAYSSLLRVGDRETSTIDIVLGSSAHKAYPAHELRPGEATAGIGWMKSDAGIVRYRGAYLTESQRRQVAARMKADRS